jgi:hypothetical protein
VGWQEKGVGHEVFLTEKGGAPKNIGSEGGQLFYYSGEKFDIYDYCSVSCAAREQARQQILFHVTGKILNFNQQIDPKCNAQIPKMQCVQKQSNSYLTIFAMNLP